MVLVLVLVLVLGLRLGLGLGFDEPWPAVASHPGDAGTMMEMTARKDEMAMLGKESIR